MVRRGKIRDWTLILVLTLLQEHTEDISKIPGWRRTRRFELVDGDGPAEGQTELLAVHDFDHENGLDGPEHQLAKSRPWRLRIVDLVQTRKHVRFEFFHEFEAADYRRPPPVAAITTNGEKEPVPTGANSWVFDGSVEGPVIVFCNSLLTNLHIWDHTIKILSSALPHVRFLRYNTGGYESASAEKVTISLLADDLAALLDHLHIQKCAAVVGVSMGGITAINFALRYPERVDCFVSCDCNVLSTATNTQAWQDRITLAKTEGGWEKLADQTVVRWFAPESIEAQTLGVSHIRKMVLAASREGFENCAQALCDVDLSGELKNIVVPGFLVAGERDGILPKTMAAFSKNIRDAYFTEILGTGHLPMVEDPKAFVEAIVPWLKERIAR